MKTQIERFRGLFGDGPHAPACAWGPGRVELIGGHTDYNGGFALPIAIDRGMRIVFRPSGSGRVRVWSEDYAEMDEFDPDAPQRGERSPWADYMRGTAWALREAGRPVRPLEGVLSGDVPIGAGLSSSAAFEVAAALALCPESELESIGRTELALICQRAENEFVGVNCGILDQFASIYGEEGRAVLIDCRSLDHRLLPLDADDLTVVVANTMVERGLAGSAYNERRSTCERAARKIGEKTPGVSQLRDVTTQTLESCRGLLTPVEYRRARHVVTENGRVLRAVEALENRDWRCFGEMMTGSHRSLRDDYEVSCDELDTMVSLAHECDGVFGSRMTGAGFGGCTVTLVEAVKSDELVGRLVSGYEHATGMRPDVFQFKPSRGAGRLKV